MSFFFIIGEKYYILLKKSSQPYEETAVQLTVYAIVKFRCKVNIATLPFQLLKLGIYVFFGFYVIFVSHLVK